MKFIQTISFSTSRIDDMRALSDEYDRDQGGSAPGFIGTKVVKDRDRENAYMVIAEFESHELAMENSARPETDAFAKRMAELAVVPTGVVYSAAIGGRPPNAVWGRRRL